MPASASDPPAVILLHGLCRTPRSMRRMAGALERDGYFVWNGGYPSRTASIERLSEEAVARGLAACRGRGARTIHFVTHSLGGILVRSYLSRHEVPELGRVVMLGPPNRGSEMVDRLRAWPLFRRLHGPAGGELGTGPDSTPCRLGPAAFCVGVIAGNRSVNWINSLLIPGRNDGKVSVERTKLDGMADHAEIAAAHPFIVRNRRAIGQTLHFLRHGKFLAAGDSRLGGAPSVHGARH